jgi:hypothetical protein
MRWEQKEKSFDDWGSVSSAISVVVCIVNRTAQERQFGTRTNQKRDCNGDCVCFVSLIPVRHQVRTRGYTTIDLPGSFVLL